MSGILRRTALLCKYKDGVYDFGWRRVVTGLGTAFEPTPLGVGASSTSAYDMEYGDMIGHVDDVEFVEFGNWNVLYGGNGGVSGSADGIVHSGTFLTITN